MDVRDLARRLTQALEDQEYDLIKGYVGTDFRFMSQQLPQPLTMDEWIAVAKSWRVAFPNLRYNFDVNKVDGDNVTFTTQITGTHTGWLDLSAIGMNAVGPTNKRISLPKENGTATIKGGKIQKIMVQSSEKTGLMGILTQLGVEIPMKIKDQMTR